MNSKVVTGMIAAALVLTAAALVLQFLEMQQYGIGLMGK